MRRPAASVLLALLVPGCSALRPVQEGPTRSPDDAGDVLVYLQPLPADSSRISFRLESVAALNADGSRAPLKLALSDVGGPDPGRARLLASGRVPPGQYVGLSVTISSAALSGAEGPSALLVSPEPANIPVPFSVQRRRGNVLRVSLDPERSVEKAFAFTPAFAAVLAERTVPGSVGACSVDELHGILVFDKLRREVSEIVPTGTRADGIALDPLQSRAYVALPSDDAIEIFDLQGDELINRMRQRLGDQPTAVVLSRDASTLVAINERSRTASFIDVATLSELDRVQIGEDADYALMDRGGRRVYVFNPRSSSITVLDVANHAAAGSIATDGQPIRGRFDRAGRRLYVLQRGSQFMLVFSVPELLLAKRVQIGLGATAIHVDSATDLVYIARQDDPRLHVYEPLSLMEVETIDVGGAASDMAIDDLTNTLFIAVPDRRSITVVDLTSRRIVGQMDVGNAPRRIVLAGGRD